MSAKNTVIESCMFWLVYQQTRALLRVISPIYSRLFALSTQTEMCPKPEKRNILWRRGSHHASLCMLMPEGDSFYRIWKEATICTCLCLCLVENTFKLHAEYSIFAHFYSKHSEHFTIFVRQISTYNILITVNTKNQCMLSLCFNYITAWIMTTHCNI